MAVICYAAVVKGAVCSSGRNPRLKIGGGFNMEPKGERAEWCQVSTALQSGKQRLHYSVVRASCTGSLKGFSNLLSFALC